MTVDDVLAAVSGTCLAGWFDRLPADEQQRLLSFRAHWQEHRPTPAAAFAKGIIRVCPHLKLPSHKGLAEWLRREN